ncbi:MAG: T9SS type A sorting domain-containing protein [Crocinitomicaceae bacterium]|nr:T9SS type A sorting domain-containing protein [Flavobacteriales bacterium]NQZ37177.1 T9SS type A sorting domain-containing protein [Crocinitomicaceae bacterium]
MKSLLTYTMAMSCGLFSFAQNTSNSLDYNNAGTTISNSGSVFNDFQNGSAGYEIPKGGGNHIIYSGQFWFAAKDASGGVFTTLGGLDDVTTDIDHGPFSTTGAYSDPSYDQPYMVTLCQEEIDNFSLWWECLNGATTVGCETVVQPSTEILNSILNWPGNGDPSLGQSFSLAPFYDRDGDGTYDPLSDGDYPIIKGCCATYIIQNDVGNIHTYSGTDPIGIEMHYLFYQFGAGSDLYNTTFVDVMAINYSGTNYPEFTHGFMVDGDLGYSQDDYFGSDSLTNTMIFYNADNMDEGAYLANPPAFGVAALQTPSTSIVPFGMFTSASASWNLMNGVQPNGMIFEDPNANPTKFMLSGDPNDVTAWSEISEGHVPGERKGIMATTQGVFNAGDTVLQTYAIVYYEGGNNLQNASNVSNLASWAKTFYDTEINDGCDAGAVASIDGLDLNELSVYPNPTSDQFVIKMEDENSVDVSISDMHGREIRKIQNYANASSIDLSGNEPGIYLIRIETEKGQVIRRIVLE